MKYVYTISYQSPHGKYGFTAGNGYNYRDMLAFYRFYSADSAIENKKVVLSVRAVDANGNIVNSCVLRSCNYYDRFLEV